MADADWIRYKQIRGKPLPETIEFRGTTYTLAKVFKRDFYAATGLFQKAANGPHDLPAQVVFKHYHTEPFMLLPLRWLGRMLWRREMRLGWAVRGVPGVAHVLGRYGKSGLVREYIRGSDLREHLLGHGVDAPFFTKLKQSLAAVHACGIAHNDLNKPENILVRDDGSPVLIDFQIAFQPRSRLPVIKQLQGAMLRYLQGMDWYHMLKHQRRQRPQDLTAAEWGLCTKRGVLLNLHAWLLRRPYRVVRHLIMRTLLLSERA